MSDAILKHTCKDCHHELDMIQQPRWNTGYITLLTCWNPDCLLYGYTLSSEQYSRMNDDQWEQYRAGNRAKLAKVAS